MLLLLLDGSPPDGRPRRRLPSLPRHADRTPAFVGLAAGATAAFALAVFCGHARLSVPLVLLGAVVAVVGWTSPLPATAAVAGVAWLSLTAFDVLRDGDLRMPTAADRDRLLLLVGVAAAAWLARATAAAVGAVRRA